MRPATAASEVVAAGHVVPAPQPDQLTATPMTSAPLSSVAPVGVKHKLSRDAEGLQSVALGGEVLRVGGDAGVP